MPTAADLKAEELLTMFKGEPGTRKSTQALSYPLPQYWFSTDQKMNALLIPIKKWGIDKTKVEYDDYSGIDANSSWNNMLDKSEKLRLSCPFKTLIVDSVTSAGDVINLQTLRLTTGSTRKSGEEKGTFIGGVRVDTYDEYKAEASGFRSLIANLLDIKKAFGIQVILVAHVIGERKKEEVGITAHSRIIITGGKSISGKICAYASEAYHFDVKPHHDPTQEGSYRILTRHTGEDFARTTLPLPNEIVFGEDKLYEKWIAPASKELYG